MRRVTGGAHGKSCSGAAYAAYDGRTYEDEKQVADDGNVRTRADGLGSLYMRAVRACECECAPMHV